MGSRPRKGLPAASVIIFSGCGIWLIGLGLYFMFLRPALLPEDPRYIGTTLTQLHSSLPGLELWLRRVFTVMGGFMAGAGALTLFVAVTAASARKKGTGGVLTLAGLVTVGTMSVTNFIIDSDFKWLLFAPALLWLIGLACYFVKR